MSTEKSEVGLDAAILNDLPDIMRFVRNDIPTLYRIIDWLRAGASPKRKEQ